MRLEDSAKASPAGTLPKGLILLIGGIGVLLIAAIVLLAALLLRKPGADQIPAAVAPGAGNVVADDSFNPGAMVEKAAENMFEVKMNADWFFPDGSSAAEDAYVANSTANSESFYFEVLLADTEEVIYTSPVVPLGRAVKNFTLAKFLPKGDYDCICRYNLLGDDNETVEDVVSVTAKVHIQS